jgi:hypothetical protein
MLQITRLQFKRICVIPTPALTSLDLRYLSVVYTATLMACRYLSVLYTDGMTTSMASRYLSVLFTASMHGHDGLHGRHSLSNGLQVIVRALHVRHDPLLVPWDGIHQIVSRFLERFCYMCPLLFSCVFPS